MYNFQDFTNGNVFTDAQADQIEINIRDHIHGQGNISVPLPPLVLVSKYATLSAAITDVGATEKTLVIDTSINASNSAEAVTVPATMAIWPLKPGIIAKGSATSFTINGPIVGDPKHRWLNNFTGGSDLSFSNTAGILHDWFGTDGAAFNIAASVCGSTNVLLLGDKTYTSSITRLAACCIKGMGYGRSILYYTGTGDALDLSEGMYNSHYADFTVKGNASSRDGITLWTEAGDNNAYSTFENIYSSDHGRHGLYHREAWATRYINCKFNNNGGLGVYCHMELGDTGAANAVGFLHCESRWNGGTDTATIHSDNKGGVKIDGAAAVWWHGGVVESNNAWAFIIGLDSQLATRNIDIRNVYLEATPNGANVGGLFYMGLNWTNVTVQQCWMTYGNGAGKTGYAFYVNPSSDLGARFKEGYNFVLANGAGTNVRNYGKVYSMNDIRNETALLAKAQVIDAIYGINSNIRGLWMMDALSGSTVTDRGTLSHNITLSDTVSNLGYGTEVYAPYVQFTSGGYWSHADHNDFSFGNGTTDSACSFVALVKRLSSGSTPKPFIAKADETTGSEKREWYFQMGQDDKLYVLFSDESTDGSIGRHYSTSLTSDINEWHCYIATYDGSSTEAGIKIYRDGVRVDNTSISSGSYTAMENLTAEVGSFITYTTGVKLKGDYQEACIGVFNAELTAAQVTRITNLLLGYVGVIF